MKTLKALALVGIVAAAFAWSLSLRAQRVVAPLPTSVSDLTTAQVVEIRDGNGTVVLKGAFVKKSDKTDKVELNAALTATSGNTGQGKAEIELEKSGGRVAKQEIEVTVKRLQPQAMFKLYVDATEVASFTTNGKGDADLKFSSKQSAQK